MASVAADCDVGDWVGSGFRLARSAAVVSVASSAATRCVCRLVVAAAAARLRAADVLDTADARAAPEVFAASPRVVAALDDAARDASFRFDAGCSASASGAVSAPADASAVLARLAVQGARGAVDVPPSADTPVPVPSGASSS